MIRSQVILFFVTLAVFSATAQKNQPAFGVVDKADLEMKDCDFDKGAEAIKLIDWESTEYQSGRIPCNQ